MEGVIADTAGLIGVSHEGMKANDINRISPRPMTPPKDVADMVAFESSDLGRNLSGQSFPVDGNMEVLNQPEKPLDSPLHSDAALNKNTGKTL